MKQQITAIWHTAQPLIAVVLLCLALNSCVKETAPLADEQGAEAMDFALELNPPGAFTLVDSRAMSDAAQNAINRAEVLVFQNNILLYHKTGVLTDIDGVKKKVAVNLKTSQTVSDLFDIMVIGNAPTFSFANYVGKTKAELKTDFNVAVAGKWAGSEFVMYGESLQLLVKPSTTALKIQMLRSLARIDVGVGAYNEATDSWAGLTDIFTLTEVRVVNSRDKYAAIPAAITFSAGGYVKVSAPTIPAGTAVQGTTAATALTYSGADIIGGSQLKSSIFIAEAPNTADKVTLLIGGSYKSGATTYYRVDMCVPRANTPDTYDYLNILRNHLYRISITNVSGDGYTTADEALVSPPINITITFTPIEEGGFGDVIFDGNSYLMTDLSALSELPLADGIMSFDLFTVKAGFVAGVNATVSGPGLTTPITLVNGVSKLISAVIPSTTTSGKYTVTVGRLVKHIPFNLSFNNGFIPNLVLAAGGWPTALLPTEGGLQLATRGEGVLPGGVATDDDPTMQWKTAASATAGTNPEAGYGKSSTDAMVGAEHPAAQYCRSMGDGWFLPSRDELLLIYNNKSLLSSPYAFTANTYWSSTNASAAGAYAVNFNDGAQTTPQKTEASHLVRCIKGTIPVTISVTPTTQANISSGGGKYTVKVTSNYPWSVSSTLSGVTFSPSSGAAGTDLSVEITVPNNTGATRNVATTFKATGGGTTATASWTGTQAAVPPTPYIEINGLKWTTGSLVANGSYGAKVGAPADGGLYFLFGSLLGWKGGATGDGTGICTKANGTWFGGSSFNAASEIAVTPSAFTTIAGIGATWPYQTKNLYYFGDNTYATDYARLRDFTGFSAGTLADKGVGDPCRVYLGSPWRMPTAEEFKALCNNAVNGATPAAANAAWTTSPVGMNFNNNSTKLFIPASGCRYFSDGTLYNVGTRGYYWSESVNSATHGYCLHFNSGFVNPQNGSTRRYGFPVRCVQGELTPAAISVTPTTQANIPIAGSKYTVRVTSNYGWSASSTLSGVAFSPSSGAAGTNVSVEITVPSHTSTSARSIPAVFTATGGGATATATWTGAQAAVPPTPYIEINGLKWTTGNLVANGSNGAKVGTPTDGGLYFLFGSLLGWKGGATGDGTGVSTKADGSFFVGSSFNAADEIAVTPSAFTTIAGIGATWPNQTKNLYYFGDNTYAANYAKLRDFSGFSDGSLATSGVGDPCRAYLGSTWRLPTTEECVALNTSGSAWVTSPAVGRNFNNSSSSKLFIPASGFRNSRDGAVYSVGTNGLYWSESVRSAVGGYRLNFSSSSVYPQDNNNRRAGYPVRCVQ